ncbi:DUF1804 family protein [Methylosoma difficile]
MAHSQETKDKVRQLYIEGMPLTSAALSCEPSVSYDTAKAWKATAKKKGDDWDTARAAFSISGAGIDQLNLQVIENFNRQAITIQREIDNDISLTAMIKVQLHSTLADSYAKFSKAFSRLNPQFSGLSIALDTLKTIVEYLRKNDPAALKAIRPHIENIGAILGKRHGHK